MAKIKKKTAKKKATKKKSAVKKKTATKKKVAPKKRTKTVKKKKAVVKKKAQKASKAKAKPKAKAKAKAKTQTGEKAEISSRKTPSPGESPAKPKKLRVIRVKGSNIDPVILKIRGKLLQSRNEVLRMIRSSQAMERDVSDVTFSNEIDLASSLEGREMLFQLSSRDRNELRLIEDALFKIEQGTYGNCESCSKVIAMKRLQILPFTSLCIECQESMEV